MKSMRTPEITVYGLCNVFYDSFYIKGLQDYFGIKNVKFSVEGFPGFPQGTFAAVIVEDNKETRLVFDSRDADDIVENTLAWCDYYGKVNYNPSNIPNGAASKIIPIGPSFGIRIWSLPKSILKACANYLKFRKTIKYKKEFIANYWRQYTRIRLEDYYDSQEKKEKYVFFMGSIWKKEGKTNLFRSNFINACKSIDQISFEGGFAPRKDGNNQGYDALVTLRRYPFPIYIAKLKKSMVAFNTPAVLSCHGWKLGEFLAMGKAIVSTAHINVLPEPLVEGIHITYVDQDDQKSYTDKITSLVNSDSYRIQMEKNARHYFETVLSPEKVVEKVFLQSR